MELQWRSLAETYQKLYDHFRFCQEQFFGICCNEHEHHGATMGKSCQVFAQI